MGRITKGLSSIVRVYCVIRVQFWILAARFTSLLISLFVSVNLLLWRETWKKGKLVVKYPVLRSSFTMKNLLACVADNWRAFSLLRRLFVPPGLRLVAKQNHQLRRLENFDQRSSPSASYGIYNFTSDLTCWPWACIRVKTEHNNNIVILAPYPVIHETSTCFPV